MKSKFSISELRNDVGKYQHFLLTSNDAMSPLRVEMQFDQIAVNIAPYPYVALKGTSGIAAIRHIETIQKKTDGAICTYIFACLDYSGEDGPFKTELQMDCFP